MWTFTEKTIQPVFIPDFRRVKPPTRMQLPTAAPSVVEAGEPEVIKQKPEIEPKQNEIRPEKETTTTPVVTQTLSTSNPTTFASTILSGGIGKCFVYQICRIYKNQTNQNFKYKHFQTSLKYAFAIRNQMLIMKYNRLME